MQSIRRLVVEAHRRSLWQVFTIYVAVSWGGYQVIGSLPGLIGVPDWVPGMSLVLFLIGLPIVVATAFVQEGGPSGSRPAPAPDSAPAAASAPGPHLLTWKRAFIGAGLALLLLTASAGGYVGLRASGVGPFGSLRATGELAADDILILADFGNATPDTTLGDVIAEALRIDLSSGLRVADPATIGNALQRMRITTSHVDRGLARDIAEREGFRAVIAGEVGQLGESYVLTAEILRVSDGVPLASFRETARTSADLLDATERLSRAIRQKAGEKLTSINRSAPLEQVTTRSLTALRKYTAARRGAAGAIQLLEEAVALDTTFAMAHRYLGARLQNAGRRAEAQEALAAAFRHRGNMTPLEAALVEADYYQIVLRDHPRALNAYNEALAIDSLNLVALNNASLMLNDMLRFAAAESLAIRGSSLPQPSSSQIGHLFAAQFALGKFDDALRTIERHQQLYPNVNAPIVNRLHVAFFRDEYPLIDSIATEAEQLSNPSSGWTLRENAAVARGQLARALEYRERQRTRALQTSGNVQLGEAWLAIDLVQHGLDTARAVAMVDDYAAFIEERDRALLDQPIETIALAYAVVGNLDRARYFLDLAERRQNEPGANPFTTEIKLARARVAILEGRPADAILPLHQAQATCDICLDIELGHAFDALGQPDSALAYYERFVNTPRAELPRWQVGNRSLAILRLAELHDARGDRAKAAEYYARIVQLWADADPHLQPRVEAAKRRLAELRVER